MRRAGRVGIVPVLAILVLGAIVVRLTVDARSALRRGDDALAQAQPERAVLHFLEAARLYVPLSPLHVRALDRLHEVAAGARAAGNASLERQALEAERAALLGTRSFYTPEAQRLEPLNGRLAELYASAEAARRPAETHERRVAWHLQRLQAAPGPSLAASVVALVGLAMWVVALGFFVVRGVDRSLRLQRRAAVTCAVAFALGLVMFLIGLRMA